MGFDKIETRPLGKGSVEYGIIHGNRTLILIKSETDSLRHKHLQMAKALHEQIGATVICAPSPKTCSSEMQDYTLLREIINEKKGEPTLYFIGISSGALQGLFSATRQFGFKRLFLINMPLSPYIQRLKAALLRGDAHICFFYGEKASDNADIVCLHSAIHCLQYAPKKLVLSKKTVTLDIIPNTNRSFIKALVERISEE